MKNELGSLSDILNKFGVSEINFSGSAAKTLQETIAHKSEYEAIGEAFEVQKKINIAKKEESVIVFQKDAGL